MSQENVERVAEGYARYNAGERTPELDYWHEDVEFHAFSTGPDTAVHRGIGAVRRQFAWGRSSANHRAPLRITCILLRASST
jgi:hypothetical protein